MKIPFNKPYLAGREIQHIVSAAYKGHISGNGIFTKKSQIFLEERYGFKHALLTTSCTDALEMTALLMDIKAGDEVIVPSYTFVSSANAYVLRGAKIVFADSCSHHPNIDLDAVEQLITEKTKAIVLVHYGGVACDMDKAMALSKKYGVYIVEDAAHAVDSYYKGKPLGGIGHFGVFSFHETKNISSGEGGLLVINDSSFSKRAEILWEKGTNRSAFFRGEVNKYGWVDIGSSFLPSDIIAAVLYGQLEQLDEIQHKRRLIHSQYDELLKELHAKGKIYIPELPDYATENGNMYYFLVNSNEERNRLLAFLNANKVHAVFHYLPLHLSSYYTPFHDGRLLPNSKYFSDCIIRLPFFYELPHDWVAKVAETVFRFYK
ncbi:MAG: dTDP-4-amino-4,6-dideoxygalactose transaminase [Bacteroidales bacterium]